jgi:hypothetical protein
MSIATIRAVLGIVGVIGLGGGYLMWMGASTVVMHFVAAGVFLAGVALILGSDALAKRTRQRSNNEGGGSHAN